MKQSVFIIPTGPYLVKLVCGHFVHDIYNRIVNGTNVTTKLSQSREVSTLDLVVSGQGGARVQCRPHCTD